MPRHTRPLRLEAQYCMPNTVFAHPSLFQHNSLSGKGNLDMQYIIKIDWLAERQGFEPWDPLQDQRFSRPPRSTTPAPLRGDWRERVVAFRRWFKGFCIVWRQKLHRLGA